MFNIFDYILGNPEKVQTKATAQWQTLKTRLDAARAAGNRTLELSIIQAMKGVSNTASNASKSTLSNTQTVADAGGMLSGGFYRVGNAVKSAASTVVDVPTNILAKNALKLLGVAALAGGLYVAVKVATK